MAVPRKKRADSNACGHLNLLFEGGITSEDMETLPAERSWTGHDLPGRVPYSYQYGWGLDTRYTDLRGSSSTNIIRIQCPKPYTSEKT